MDIEMIVVSISSVVTVRTRDSMSHGMKTKMLKATKIAVMIMSWRRRTVLKFVFMPKFPI
jgi:hypothetical protein